MFPACASKEFILSFGLVFSFAWDGDNMSIDEPDMCDCKKTVGIHVERLTDELWRHQVDDKMSWLSLCYCYFFQTNHWMHFTRPAAMQIATVHISFSTCVIRYISQNSYSGHIWLLCKRHQAYVIIVIDISWTCWHYNILCVLTGAADDAHGSECLCESALVIL